MQSEAATTQHEVTIKKYKNIKADRKSVHKEPVV